MEFDTVEQALEFETLYLAYWNYVYKHIVHHPEDFTPNEPPWGERRACG